MVCKVEVDYSLTDFMGHVTVYQNLDHNLALVRFTESFK